MEIMKDVVWLKTLFCKTSTFFYRFDMAIQREKQFSKFIVATLIILSWSVATTQTTSPCNTGYSGDGVDCTGKVSAQLFIKPSLSSNNLLD